jgi:hypothetical protein
MEQEEEDNERGIHEDNRGRHGALRDQLQPDTRDPLA